MKRWLIAMASMVLPLAVPTLAQASDCRRETFEGVDFTVCEVGTQEDLRLFLNGPKGAYGSFRAIDRELGKTGQALGFAMNAGMYHRDLSPVGLYVESGVERAPIVTREGPGNFGMLPNGVFCWGKGQYRITDSRKHSGECDYATQSGPMLVIDGALHPRFLPDSDSTYIRNGVGVSADNRRAVFVISERAVNFHHFARFFRDHLGLPNALYFDGNISRLYAPQLGRHDGGFPMGPIVGVVTRKDN